MEGRILGGPYQNLSLAEDFIVPQAAAKRCQFKVFNESAWFGRHLWHFKMSSLFAAAADDNKKNKNNNQLFL